MYSVACFETKCYENGWYIRNRKFLSDLGIDFATAYNPVIETLYYTLSITLCIKQSYIVEFMMHEKILRHILVFLAYCTFSLFFSEICAAMVLSLEETQNYREYIASMKVFLRRCGINQYLRKQVSAVIEFKWAYNKNVAVIGKITVAF